MFKSYCCINVHRVKLREKYKALRTPEFVKQMMVASVYGSMQLEEQAVSMETIGILYDKVKQEKEVLPKGNYPYC